MILFDPGLVSGSTRRTAAARRSVTRKISASRLPSPRNLARFLTDAQAAIELRGQVSVLLTTNAEIRRLNRTYRGIDRPTDVLSFSAADSPGCEERVAGDLAISLPMAQRQAARYGHSLLAEVKVLMLHGLLHLAGFDHHVDNGEMNHRERLLRARLGLPHGLIERVENDSAPLRNRTTPALSSRGRRSKGRRS